jgi:hypothetical protein
MYKIKYKDNFEFLITRSEYLAALKSWKENKNYSCKRLEATLTPFILYAGPEHNRYSRYVMKWEKDSDKLDFYIYDNVNKKLYKMDDHVNFEKMVLRIENDVPLWLTPEGLSEEEIKRCLNKWFMSYCDYVDNGEKYERPIMAELNGVNNGINLLS